LIKMAKVIQVPRISKMPTPFVLEKVRANCLCTLFSHVSGLSHAEAAPATNSTIPAMNMVALGAVGKIGPWNLRKAVPCQLIRDCCICGRHSGEKILRRLKGPIAKMSCPGTGASKSPRRKQRKKIFFSMFWKLEIREQPAKNR